MQCPKGQSRKASEQGWKQVRESPAGLWGKCIPGRRESQCKGPEANTSRCGLDKEQERLHLSEQRRAQWETRSEGRSEQSEDGGGSEQREYSGSRSECKGKPSERIGALRCDLRTGVICDLRTGVIHLPPVWRIDSWGWVARAKRQEDQLQSNCTITREEMVGCTRVRSVGARSQAPDRF